MQHSALYSAVYCISMHNRDVRDGAVQCRLSLEGNRWLEANRQKEDQRREGSAILLNAQRCHQKLLNDSASFKYTSTRSMIVPCAGAEGEGGIHPKSDRPVRSAI